MNLSTTIKRDDIKNLIGNSSLKLSKSTNIKIMLDSVKFMLIVIIKMIPTPTYINN